MEVNKKLLLYIDILGFSQLVKRDVGRVFDLYKIIDNLNVHEHNVFKAIVFSDTILIYPKPDSPGDSDQRYLVMYLIEFAQNLLYEIAGKGYFFRAVLVRGEFEHKRLKNTDQIFGRALITAYTREKGIKCTGLFIDQESQRYNDIFKTAPYKGGLRFVYLNQSLDRFYNGELGPWPVPPEDLASIDAQWHLAKDVLYLKSIYHTMKHHRDGRVRLKMANTWELYHRRYSKLLDDLVAKDFALSVLSKGFDWKPALKRALEEHRAIAVEPPTETKLAEIIERARESGRLAAEVAFKKIYGDSKPGEKGYAPCGGALMILHIDLRSSLGRFLKRTVPKMHRANLHPNYGRGVSLGIYDMHPHQEKDVDIAAKEAALKVLTEELGIEGHIDSYID